MTYPVPRAPGRSGTPQAGRKAGAAGRWWKPFCRGSAAAVAQLEGQQGGRDEKGHGQGAEDICCFFPVKQGDLLLFGSQGGEVPIDFGQGQDSLKQRTDLKQRRDCWGTQALNTGPKALSVHGLQFCFTFKFHGQGGAHEQNLPLSSGSQGASIQTPLLAGFPRPLCHAQDCAGAALLPLQHCRSVLVFSPSCHLFPFLPPPSCGHPSPSRPLSFSLHHPLASINKEVTWAWSKMLPVRSIRLPMDLGRPHRVLVPSTSTQAQPPPAASELGARGPSCVPGWCPALAPLCWSQIGAAAPALKRFPLQPHHAASWKLPRLLCGAGSTRWAASDRDAGSSSWRWQ